MKFLMFIMLLCASAIANTTDSRSIYVDGSRNSDLTSLSTEVTKTISEVVRERSICTRTQWRRVCHRVPGTCRQQCTPSGHCRRVCAPSRMQCRQVPTQVTYPCMRNRTVQRQVFDYYVNSSVQLNYLFVEDMFSNSSIIHLTQTGRNLTLSSDSTNQLVTARKIQHDSQRMGQSLEQTISYDISFQDVAYEQEMIAGSARSINLNRSIYSFLVPVGFDLNHFNIEVKLVKRRPLAKDEVLLKKVVNNSLKLSAYSNDSERLELNLRNLNVSIPRKLNIELKIWPRIDRANALNFDRLNLEKKVITKFK